MAKTEIQTHATIKINICSKKYIINKKKKKKKKKIYVSSTKILAIYVFDSLHRSKTQSFAACFLQLVQNDKENYVREQTNGPQNIVRNMISICMISLFLGMLGGVKFRALGKV